jgi:predicted SprT family Zn-dependent metalloprotease
MPDISITNNDEIIETNFVRAFESYFADPTAETYQALITAFEFLNRTFFGDRLPRPLLTLRNRGQEYGYFFGDRFETPEGGQKRSEIATNARYFRSCSIEEILSTIAHEMCHQAQHCLPEIYGAPGKRGYHTSEFARLMEEIGLITSHTGKPGGNRTGYAMADYIQPGGRFEQACSDLLSKGFRIPYVEQLGDTITSDGRVRRGVGHEFDRLQLGLAHYPAQLRWQTYGVAAGLF